MGLLSWLVLGLIVGALAKWIMPGPDPGGIVVTILIGIAGAFVGGFIGSAVGLGSVTGFNPGSSVRSYVGAEKRAAAVSLLRNFPSHEGETQWQQRPAALILPNSRTRSASRWSWARAAGS